MIRSIAFKPYFLNQITFVFNLHTIKDIGCFSDAHWLNQHTQNNGDYEKFNELVFFLKEYLSDKIINPTKNENNNINYNISNGF